MSRTSSSSPSFYFFNPSKYDYGGPVLLVIGLIWSHDHNIRPLTQDYNIESFPSSCEPHHPLQHHHFTNNLQPPPPQTNEAVWRHEMEEGGEFGEKRNWRMDHLQFANQNTINQQISIHAHDDDVEKANVLLESPRRRRRRHRESNVVD